MTRDNSFREREIKNIKQKECKKDVLEKKLTLKEGFFDLPGDEFLAMLDSASVDELESMLDLYGGEKTNASLSGSAVAISSKGELPDTQSLLSIILWWELRRPVYNLLVGLCGLVVLIALSVLNHAPADFLLFGAFSYFVSVNIFYTTVWGLHILVRCLAGDKAGVFGGRLFMVATMFSILTTLAIAVLLPLTFLLTGNWG